MYKILLATDGSDYSLASMQKIIPMAGALQAEVTILSVAEEIPFLRGTEGMSKEEIDALFMSISKEAELGLERAARLVTDFSEITEMDINPVRVHHQGATALDVKITIE